MEEETIEKREKNYDWGLHGAAEKFFTESLNRFRSRFSYANDLITKMEKLTGIRLMDLMDHMILSPEHVNVDELVEMGFKHRQGFEAEDGDEVFHNPNSMLPKVILRQSNVTGIALKTESLDAFQKKNDVPGHIDGIEFGPLRTLQIAMNDGHVLLAVERRGYDGFRIREGDDTREYLKALESFGRRNRDYSHEEDGYHELAQMIMDMQKALGTHRIADAFFRVERDFWLQRNRAACFQKERQDIFGLGWANHDHHAFRSSRQNFARLIRILELLGLKPREAFYAGEQAGWGAQVMENRASGIVVFADVDMNPREHDQDFAHKGLESTDALGTIGLWVGLHGESILQAGLHHLAVRCDFFGLKTAYEKARIGVMSPFSDFPFLKQAFTEGEPWMAREDRILEMYESDLLDGSQYNGFRDEAVIGSHVEIIERNSGFAGFNQDSVSVIIKATDPRKGIARGA